MRIRYSFGLLLLLISVTVAAVTPVHEYKLPNGLLLLVKEDNRAPVVVSQVWYKVGSSYERDGITGISHVLEHMMFRGTHQYSSEQLKRLITENGGVFNAMTTTDFTLYYEFISADHLPLVFQLEADRMHNLSLSPADFAKEIQVVMEERRLRVDDMPEQTAMERFNAAAYITNPYRQPIAGWMKDLQTMTDHKVRHWYQTWYAPNNAVVVVVGDVKPEQVYQLAKKYFGPLKPVQLPETNATHTITQLGKRTVEVNIPAKLPLLMMGYNVPVVRTTDVAWQPYALMVLSGVLSAGDSARLPRYLIRGQQIAADIDVDYDPFSRLDTVFLFSAIPAQGHTVTEIKKALFQQIKDLQTTLITPQELERVKAQVIAAKVYSTDDMMNQAYELGALAVVGLPWQLADQYVKKIEAITPAQVQQVAREYLIPNRLTIAVLKPLPTPKGATPPDVMPPTKGQMQ